MNTEELNNIKQLLGSSESVNRELGIVLALTQGMSLNELVDKCFCLLTKGWFCSCNENNYGEICYNDYALGNYLMKGYSLRADLYKYETDLILHDTHEKVFRSMIENYLKDSYPELLK